MRGALEDAARPERALGTLAWDGWTEWQPEPAEEGDASAAWEWSSFPSEEADASEWSVDELRYGSAATGIP